VARRAGTIYPFRAPMSRHDFQIPVMHTHRVVFTRGAFSPENPVLESILAEGGGGKVLVLIEQSVAGSVPGLVEQARSFLAAAGYDPAAVAVLPGGEEVKADEHLVRDVWRRIDAAHLDRHSYLLAVGGGAFLDAVGFAAATAHRGVRLLRLPSTTLAQADSGVGVKCAINAFGKKNWIGAFAVPYAVVNDLSLLHTQPEQIRRAGLSEAVKVAVVKNADFFVWMEERASSLAALERDALETCVEQSALLHARHIAEGGDPFETGSSRPLDFGHWAAHKLESLTAHRLSHAHAVAVGVALDSLYSAAAGLLARDEALRVPRLLAALQLPIFHPALGERDETGAPRVLSGLDEFREHLGGPLTVMMLGGIGRGIDLHEVDPAKVVRCVDELRSMATAPA
jgi:3-dehydroquinate synthase